VRETGSPTKVNASTGTALAAEECNITR